MPHQRNYPLLERWAGVTLPFELQSLAKTAHGPVRYDLSFAEFHSESLQAPLYRDPSAAPSTALRAAVLDWLGLTERYSPENVSFAAGANQCIMNALLALGTRESTALVPSVCRPEYCFLSEAAGMRVERIPTFAGEHFKVTPQVLVSAFNSSPSARIVILDSPANPTAQVYSPSELQELAIICADFGAFLLLDRRFWKLTFKASEPFVPDTVTQPWVIHIDSASSAWPDAGGLRAAWCVAPADASEAISLVSSHLGACVSRSSQSAVLQLMQANADTFHRELMHKRSIWLEETAGIKGIEALPIDGTCFALWNVEQKLYERRLRTANQLAEWLLETHGVLCVPGSPYGLEGYLRFSFAGDLQTVTNGAKVVRAALSR